MTKDLSHARLDGRIIETRGHRVILDADRADASGVPTKALNQAVKRNRERFPGDFCFRLTAQEVEDLKSQFVTSSEGWGGRRRSRPIAFTEHGAIMAARVRHRPTATKRSA